MKYDLDSDTVKDQAKRFGADLVGIVSAKTLNEFPPDPKWPQTPERISPHAKSVIVIAKRIPIGAGLGGGSSNAATTLKVLNKLWGCNLSDQELTTLALKLGADVPFFLKGESAWGEGIGEKLKPIKLKKAWFAIITPNCSVSTARIFSHENLTRNTQAIKMADFLAGRTENTKNDCEPVVRKLYPQVDEAFLWLGSHAEPRMTGTGSSVFAKFSSEEQAKALLKRLPDNMRGFVAEGINTL